LAIFVTQALDADAVSVGKALAQARMAKIKPDGKAMTQKDLATSVNAKPQDVGAILSSLRIICVPILMLLVGIPVSQE
jgi:hypothetical protein